MGSSDSTEASIFRIFQTHEWQAAPTAFDEAMSEGMFLNVIFDQINEKAYEQLDNAVLYEENDLWVVEEDYTDEIDYILTHPEYAAPVMSGVESSIDYSDLNDEWTGFVVQMQPHHWETLAALLSKTDVLSRLDAIARSVYVPSSQLIDEINGFAQDSIGDIVIDPYGDIPEVEEEDFDSLSQLMTWAAEKMMLEN